MCFENKFDQIPIVLAIYTKTCKDRTRILRRRLQIWNANTKNQTRILRRDTAISRRIFGIRSAYYGAICFFRNTKQHPQKHKILERRVKLDAKLPAAIAQFSVAERISGCEQGANALSMKGLRPLQGANAHSMQGLRPPPAVSQRRRDWSFGHPNQNQTRILARPRMPKEIHEDMSRRAEEAHFLKTSHAKATTKKQPILDGHRFVRDRCTF